jgi:CheY-like chemotaxis protein
MLAKEHGIALMLTDVVMPRMNGRVLADQARELKPGLRILFATGYTRNAIVHNGVVDAGVELITKPYTLEDLAIKLRRILA